MPLRRRRFLHLAGAALAMPALPPAAWALNYPARPVRVIHFEHGCVSRDEQFACYRALADLGYELASDGQDTTAWLPA